MKSNGATSSYLHPGEEIHHLIGADFFSPGNIPLRILRRNPQMPYPMHSHDFMELVVVIGGSGIHSSQQGDIAIGRGAVFVIKGDQAHGYRQLNQLNLINILFDLDKLAIPLLDIGRSPGFHSMFVVDPVTRFQELEHNMFFLEDGELEQLVDLIDTIDRQMESAEHGSGFLGISGFMQIIHFVSAAYDRRHRGDEAGSLPFRYRLGAVFSYLESHLTEVVSIDELTELAGMSKSTLLRAFHAVCGQPPIRYHQIKRIEKACWYIQHGRNSMTELAELLGYNDSNYFSRQFRQIMGCSPREYRKSLKFGPGAFQGQGIQGSTNSQSSPD